LFSDVTMHRSILPVAALATVALDTRSGDERWRFAAGRAVTSSPAVSDGVVFVGSRDGR
jgi:outer membrane protein assembly factor BamB